MYRKLGLGLIFFFLLSACAGQGGQTLSGAGPRVWIDAPLSGAEAPPGANIQVVAYASAPGGASQMSLWVDGAAVGAMSVTMVKDGLARGEGTWTPAGPGDYWLTVQVVTAEGGSAMSQPALLRVGGEMPAAGVPPVTVTSQVPLLELRADATSLKAGECTFLHWNVSVPQPQSIDLNGQQVPPQGEMQVCPCQTMTYDLIVFAGDKYAQTVTINVTGECVTVTLTPPPPQREIYFQADPLTIPAGGCTTLSWKNDAQSTTLNGQQVEWYGSQQVCNLCTSQTYTLEVVWPDGARDVRTLTVNVSGSCQAPPVTVPPPPTEPPTEPPPPQDTTPPSTPESLKPGSTDPGKSQDLGSCSPVVLRWQPVTDQGGSGLQGYRVSLQRNDNGQWQSLEPYFIIYEPSVDVTQWLDAGWDYRWDVWAIDNAGNDGAPSVWRYFGCPIE